MELAHPLLDMTPFGAGGIDRARTRDKAGGEVGLPGLDGDQGGAALHFGILAMRGSQSFKPR